MHAFLAVLRTLLVLAYPVTVYFGLQHLSPHTLGLVLVAVLVPGLLLRMHQTSAETRWAVARLPLTVAALAGLGAVLGEPRFYLALPVLINVALLANFAGSLRQPVSLVEHYARLYDPDFPPDEGPAYCRAVTRAWVWFFAVNATVCAVLAIAAPVAWWALYTGLLAYILIGLGFTIEFIVRKRTFRRFGSSLPDRLLARLLRA